MRAIVSEDVRHSNVIYNSLFEGGEGGEGSLETQGFLCHIIIG